MLTTPSGALLEIKQGAKGSIAVNGHALAKSNLELQVETIRRALDKKVALEPWSTVFGVSSAGAATAIEYGMIAALIATAIIAFLRFGAPKIVQAVGPNKAESKDMRTTLAQHFDLMGSQCEAERAARRLPFDSSLTGQLMRKLEEQNVVSFVMASRPGECATAVDNYIKSSWQNRGSFARGDANAACAKLDAFLGCVREYRKIPGAYFPDLNKARGVARPIGDTATPAQPPGETTPSETAR